MRVSDQDHARISAAIARAEQGTSGEIFCVITRRVSAYRDVRLFWAAMAALLLPMGLIPLGFDPAWFPGIGDAWEAAHMAAREMTVGRALAAYAVVQAATFVAVFLITSLPLIRRWATPAPVRRARVRSAALKQFMAHGLHQTQERTGVLIFAALEDHRVEIIADEGIHALVDQTVWADAAAALVKALRAGQVADGFERSVDLCGQVLGQHFPPRADNPDELPNRLVVL